MTNRPNNYSVQAQMQRALKAERKSKAKSDTRRALVGVFIVIPGVVIGAIVLYRLCGAMLVSL